MPWDNGHWPAVFYMLENKKNTGQRKKCISSEYLQNTIWNQTKPVNSALVQYFLPMNSGLNHSQIKTGQLGK